MAERVRDLLETRRFLTNAGTETYLMFQQGFDLEKAERPVLLADLDQMLAITGPAEGLFSASRAAGHGDLFRHHEAGIETNAKLAD